MTFPWAGRARLLLLGVCAFAVLVGALVWYGAQTVSTDCLVAYSQVTGRDGARLPDANGRGSSDQELIDRAYRRALETGRCDPPRTRWEQWLD
ncbi:hypothetical protein [Streptomyces sp. NRRL S-1521]|uniref:hypothetical protein n=1 Tax=Streptomyces sp. NRRL S-1521 TaxID=1609100 RepID=UPI000A5AB418|nr:hypothetical protein [Streptomyces sp. NRRL S-1521]